MVITEPSVFFSEMVRAVTSTPVISASRTVPALLVHMGFDPVSLDALQARCGLDTASLQAQLLTLELDGTVGRLPGGLFQRLARA